MNNLLQNDNLGYYPWTQWEYRCEQKYMHLTIGDVQRAVDDQAGDTLYFHILDVATNPETRLR